MWHDFIEDELPNILINREETKVFIEFTSQLNESSQDLSLHKDALEEHQKAANFQISRIRSDTPKSHAVKSSLGIAMLP